MCALQHVLACIGHRSIVYLRIIILFYTCLFCIAGMFGRVGGLVDVLDQHHIKFC